MACTAPAVPPGLGLNAGIRPHSATKPPIVIPTKPNGVEEMNLAAQTKNIQFVSKPRTYMDENQMFARDYYSTSQDLEDFVQAMYPGAEIRRDFYRLPRTDPDDPKILKSDTEDDQFRQTGQDSFYVVPTAPEKAFLFRAIRVDLEGHSFEPLSQSSSPTLTIARRGNIIYAEDRRPMTRWIDDMTESYNESRAKAISRAAILMAFDLFGKNYRFLDFGPENILLCWDSNYENIVGMSLANVSTLKHLNDFDDRIRLNDDWDEVNLAQIRDANLIGPEASNLRHCTEKNKQEQKIIAPTTYVSLKHLEIFKLALLCTQIFLQNIDSSNEILEVIEEITVEEFDDDNDVYERYIYARLTQLISDSGCGIVRKQEAEDLLLFLMEMFGTIEKSTLEDVKYSSKITTSREDDPDDLLRKLDTLDFEYLTRVEYTEYPSSTGEDHVERMLREIYGVNGEISKRSNPEKFLGQKNCVTFETTREDGSANPVKRMFRVFLKRGARWFDIFSLYRRIQYEQDKGHCRARRYFPRVFRIEDKANCFVVEEACVDGVELIEYLKKLKKWRDLHRRKQEQLWIVEQLFEVVALLHEWGFIHGDIGNDNFMVAADGTIRIIDNESCVFFGNFDEYVDVGSLHLWTKEHYESFEHVSYKWFLRHDLKPPLMTLKQLDEFALGMLASETLVLSWFDRSPTFNEETGVHDVHLFQETVHDHHWYYSYNSPSTFKQEMDILLRLFQGHVENGDRLCSRRDSIASLLPQVQALRSVW